MFRIAFFKMLVLLRLAIVASLVVYTLPSASYAMHGSASTTYSAMDAGGDHDMSSQSADMDHHEHDGSKTASKDSSKPVKQDCCSDFCISLAIVSRNPDFAMDVSQAIRHFYNDGLVSGQLSSLHRPPSIRA